MRLTTQKIYTLGAKVELPQSLSWCQVNAVLWFAVLSTADHRDRKICRDKGLKLVPFESCCSTNSNTNPVFPGTADPLFCLVV